MTYENCEHDKVYAHRAILTFPAKNEWICRKCGYKGIETMKTLTDLSEYQRLIEKFKEE